MAPIDNPNVGPAFGLVAGAGAATALGASVVFFPSLVQLASKRVLASALGISAGVMTYVSFVEIFAKSQTSFMDAGYDPSVAYAYATLCFFGGVVALLLISFFVKVLSCEKRHHHHHHHHHPDDMKRDEEAFKCEDDGCSSSSVGNGREEEIVAPHCVGCSRDPVRELDEWKQRAEEEKQESCTQDKTVASNDNSAGCIESQNGGESQPGNLDQFDDGDMPKKCIGQCGSERGEEEETSVRLGGGCGGGGGGCGGSGIVTSSRGGGPTPCASASGGDKRRRADVVMDHEALARRENKKLVRMGVNTALAIGLHNFPEGLATFVAALENPRVGAILAIAIGIHNVPEGLCVALPIYYATGNRWKAFLWACISGVSEPVAALLGWAVLANSFSDGLYAILFGIVAGMMVMISARELLPTAHRYDTEDTVVTYSFIGGMVIMALSLVLFQL